MKLDEKDYALLYELDKNARQPLINLAKKLKINKDTVAYRIKRLENKGIIKGYYTEINTSLLGYINFRLYLKFFDITQEEYEEIKNYFINHPNTFYVGATIGDYNINIGIATRSIYEFKDMFSQFKGKYGKFIEREKISIFTRVISKPRQFLVKNNTLYEKPTWNILLGGENKVTLDEKDYAILNLLADNGKMSSVEMSRILNMPSNTILYRIKELINKKVIVNFRASINWRAIGIEHYKVDILLNNYQDIKKVYKWGLNHPHITYINETIGGSDFEIEVEVNNKEELENIMYELGKKVSIRKWWYHYIKDYVKLRFVLNE